MYVDVNVNCMFFAYVLPLARVEDVSRRAWKMSLRTDEGRGEVVYQAAFQPPVGAAQRVKVPFSDFRLVRGPVALAGAPPLSNLSAVYQIGFTVTWRQFVHFGTLPARLVLSME